MKLTDALKAVNFCKAWDLTKLSPSFNLDLINPDIEDLKSSIGKYYMAKLQKTVKNNANGDCVIYLNILSLKTA